MDETKYLAIERIDNGYIVTLEYWDGRFGKHYFSDEKGVLLAVKESTPKLLPLSGMAPKEGEKPVDDEDDDGIL